MVCLRAAAAFMFFPTTKFAAHPASRTAEPGHWCPVISEIGSSTIIGASTSRAVTQASPVQKTNSDSPDWKNFYPPPEHDAIVNVTRPNDVHAVPDFVQGQPRVPVRLRFPRLTEQAPCAK